MIRKNKIYQLHKKYAHGKYSNRLVEIIWTHSQIVKKIAVMISDDLIDRKKILINRELLEEGVLVHDIGVYSCFDDNYKQSCPYVHHGMLGYKILIKEGWSEEIARFAKTHLGVGISEKQAKKCELSEIKNYIPITLEEEIVSYADMFHSKGHPKFNNYQEQEKKWGKIEKDYVVICKRFRDKFGIPDLTKLKSEYNKWHREINQWVKSV